MLKAIKLFFEEKINVVQEQDLDYLLRLATATLMVEMMLDDGETHLSEKNVLKKRLQQTFSLSTTEASELFDLAHQQAKQAVDYYPFTSIIAKHFSQAEKIKVIENLWAVAFADNHLDPYEELMVRRIADLIYVSHTDFIKAKYRVIDET